MLRSVILLIVNLLASSTIMAACPAVPSAPATIPSCASLTELPWSTGNNLANSTNYGVGTSANSCGNTVTFAGTHSLGGGNASSNIYIKNGETLRITGSINTSFTGNIYVLVGGTLRIDQQINGGNIYVYGTLIHNPSSNVDVSNSATVYVAQGGLYNAGNFNLTGNGRMIVEGSFVTTRLRTMNSTTSQFCVNRNGCAGVRAVDMWQGSASNPIFTTDNGNGYVYYTQNTCPTMVAGYTYTTSASLTVCAPNLTTGSTCTAFGSATQRTGANCTPAASCATVVALPITLRYFKAKKTANGVMVSWEVSARQNSDYFIVLRSKNGLDWTELGTVSTGERDSYSLVDDAPLSGTNYYKLQEVSTEGVKKDYAIDVLTLEAAEVSVLISPNPSSGSFSITLSDEFPEYQMEMTDSKGKFVGKYVLAAGKNAFSEELAAGVYFVSIRLGHTYKTHKVLVQ